MPRRDDSWQAERDLGSALRSLETAVEQNTEAQGGAGGGPSVPGVSPRDRSALNQMLAKPQQAPTSSGGFGAGFAKGFGPGLRATSGGRSIAGMAGSVRRLGAMSGAGVVGGAAGLAVGAIGTSVNVAANAARTFSDDTITGGEKKLRFGKYLASFGGQIGSDAFQAFASSSGLERARRTDVGARGSFRSLVTALDRGGAPIPNDGAEIQRIAQPFIESNRRIEAVMANYNKNVVGDTDRKIKQTAETMWDVMKRTTGELEMLEKVLQKLNEEGK